MDPFTSFILLFFLAVILSGVLFGVSFKLEKKIGGFWASIFWVAGLIPIWGFVICH